MSRGRQAARRRSRFACRRLTKLDPVGRFAPREKAVGDSDIFSRKSARLRFEISSRRIYLVYKGLTIYIRMCKYSFEITGYSEDIMSGDYLGKPIRQKRPKGKNGENRDTAKVTIIKNGIKQVFSLGLLIS